MIISTCVQPPAVADVPAPYALQNPHKTTRVTQGTGLRFRIDSASVHEVDMEDTPLDYVFVQMRLHAFSENMSGFIAKIMPHRFLQAEPVRPRAAEVERMKRNAPYLTT